MIHDYENLSSVRYESDFNVISHGEIIQNNCKVDRFLRENGVDVEFVRSIPLECRSSYLIEKLIGEVNLKENVNLEEDNQDDDEVGLLIVKPEILPFADAVVQFLNEKGFEARLLEPTTPSKKGWLETYGYMLNKYPDVINIYIVQCSIGVRPVIFRHQNRDSYIDMIKQKGTYCGDVYDKDVLFDSVFCGKASEGCEETLRGSVSLPAMKFLGFDNFSGYASSFDPCSYFKDASWQKRYVAFNGIHVPSNRIEKAKNIKTFLKDEEL